MLAYKSIMNPGFSNSQGTLPHTTLGAYIVDVISGYDMNQFAARSRLDTQQPIVLKFYQCLVPADRLRSWNVEIIRLPCLALIFTHNCQRGGRKNHAVTK